MLVESLLKIDKALFSPLNKNYCFYFYYLSVFFFTLFVFLIFTIGFTTMTSKTQSLTIEQVVWLLINPLVLYFINRLYYSMCINSLQSPKY